MQSMGGDLNMKLVHFRSTKDKDHYIVEQVDTGEFFEMPPAAVEAMEALVKGSDPLQLQSELVKKYPNEEINISSLSLKIWDS
jgi:putative peptide zinc metalloprotease protein